MTNEADKSCTGSAALAATVWQLSDAIRLAIKQDLEESSAQDNAQDSIHACGRAPLSIIFRRPREVLELARKKTYQWAYKDVPQCWLRLCEDASLLLACDMLNDFANEISPSEDVELEKQFDMLSQVVKVIDHGIALSGQPRRKCLTKFCLDELQASFREETTGVPATFNAAVPGRLTTAHGIKRSEALSFEAFQAHLNTKNTPLAMDGAISYWPALSLWQSPEYLLKATIGGRRLALVEIGSSYADENLRQELMPIKRFLHAFILDSGAIETGYIAQHDLLGHVTTLSNDVITPEYCYTSPPSVQNTEGSEREPRRNIWLGPKGTRSPFHTDPDANIYCQVVGYKYFRLVPRHEGSKMYPRGTNEKGLDLSNQSQVVDFRFDRRNDLARTSEEFPLFATAAYEEVILAPGDCLYIPARCWHFAESLSTSIGVNFWWT